MMHLQAAVEPYDTFVRSLSIGPETLSVWYEPGRPQHDRYKVRHDFLSEAVGTEVVTTSLLVNAFFRWELNSCETIVQGESVHPIDYANASPDLSLTSLHYYFPWAIRTLVRWSVFCAVTRRRMRIFQDSRPYFEIGDDDGLSHEERLPPPPPPGGGGISPARGGGAAGGCPPGPAGRPGGPAPGGAPRGGGAPPPPGGGGGIPPGRGGGGEP